MGGVTTHGKSAILAKDRSHDLTTNLTEDDYVTTAILFEVKRDISLPSFLQVVT